MEEQHHDLLVETRNDGVTNENIGGNDNFGKDGVNVSEVGMMFDDEKEMFEFHKKYAYEVGFPVRKRNSKKGDDGVVRYVMFTCSREGRRIYGTSNSLKQQPTSQIDCKARISASLLSNGKWRLEVNDIAGIPLHKSYNSTMVEAGGYESMTFIEKDCRNYIEQVRRLRLGEGDAGAIQAYFANMQARCSGVYFSMDLDDESRLKNVFWADNRCRQAYKKFGDVVTFDTTYLTNKYDMPFTPFFGINHHGQSTLLGCSLIANEDTATFVRLFRTWLQCMHGQAPNRIITDQDKAMHNAIQIVFPHTKHRWCLWHILKKLPEKFGYHDDKASIFSTIHGLVYDSQTLDEFEEGWRAMIDSWRDFLQTEAVGFHVF
ncbi:protein FAR1-RELATED SEQUENCE 5-like [Olea europaea var. sylvestris]|uniref:protein FAR1-RELATED SEQUENCE 5-like n=1 Tax=Olea europaea var. sylvestris TaxID=158386 RepID=UPI000C1D6D51|nr:protein FAR1-RELATED SEQUENCE 5-like [Olea europaea var. sylvestris]